MSDIVLPNPRLRRRRPNADLVRSVQDGRRVGESLVVLSAGDEQAPGEHRRLAGELARFLVRRCDERHQGWLTLRQVLLDAGADVPWEKCARQAIDPTTERILADAATPGRTPLVRVQHAAAQERVRRIAPHLDASQLLRRLEIDPRGRIDDERFEQALVEAVSARSRERVAKVLAAALG